MINNTEAQAWAELDEWRRFGANTRLKFSFKQRLLLGAGSAGLRLVGRWIADTARWTVDSHPAVGRQWATGGQNFIFAMWHNRLSGAILFFERVCRRNRAFRMAPLVSESFDGELIARAARELGGENVRGSSSRRAAEGLREAVAEVRRGLNLAITADGPKGPRYELKPGIIMLAKLSGRPIVPMTWTADHTLQFHRSWDQLMVPLPRACVHVRLGEPFIVPQDADAQAIVIARRELETRMRSIAAESDRQTAITWQIPKPKSGERLKRRRAPATTAKRM